MRGPNGFWGAKKLNLRIKWVPDWNRPGAGGEEGMCRSTDGELDVPGLSGRAFCEWGAVAAVDGWGILMVALAEKMK